MWCCRYLLKYSKSSVILSRELVRNTLTTTTTTTKVKLLLASNIHDISKRELKKSNFMTSVGQFGADQREKLNDLAAGEVNEFAVFSQSPKVPKIRAVCSPKLEEDLQESLQSLVALNVSLRSLVWVHMSRDLKVLDWNEIPFLEECRKFSPLNMFELVCDAVLNLPEADVYVMEQMITSFRMKLAKSHLPLLLSMVSLQSSLIAALNTDYARTKQHRLFSMKSDTLTKYFHLSVEGERVSCLDLLDSILNKSKTDSGEQARPDITIPDICQNLYIPSGFKLVLSKEKDSVRDQYGIALLLALAFYDLVIFK